MGEWLLSPKLKLPGMSKRQRVECSCQALRALQLDIGRGALGVIYSPNAATGVSPGFNPDRCIHIGPGLSGCEAISKMLPVGNPDTGWKPMLH